jgi:O-acetyl-ADP-ribose deacetylase (regulator of RNase III)
VNPANVWLLHGGGASKCIADAAGEQLISECQAHIKTCGPLSVSTPMHTHAGKLQKPIQYVIHVAGPILKSGSDYNEANVLLAKTFYNCLDYANETLKVKSVAIPAISSGIIHLWSLGKFLRI